MGDAPHDFAATEGSLVRAARIAVRGDLAFGLDAVLLPASPTPSAPDRSCGRGDGGRAEERKRREQALEELALRHDRECPHCTTATAHRRSVFGEGDPFAEVLFVGEAPGETEDLEGRPFVGKAGQKLKEMIVAMGLAQEQVYIANVLKSRPPDNRTPQRHEIEQCGPYLKEQIEIIRPRLLVALGSPAAKLLLDTDEGITRLRGVWGAYRDGAVEIPVMPTYHPAYLLRNYTAEVRREVWSDLQSVVQRLQEICGG
jgi:uracil-DNA glycosylase family 4